MKFPKKKEQSICIGTVWNNLCGVCMVCTDCCTKFYGNMGIPQCVGKINTTI